MFIIVMENSNSGLSKLVKRLGKNGQKRPTIISLLNTNTESPAQVNSVYRLLVGR